jgi:hypothetical protein
MVPQAHHIMESHQVCIRLLYLYSLPSSAYFDPAFEQSLLATALGDVGPEFGDTDLIS